MKSKLETSAIVVFAIEVLTITAVLVESNRPDIGLGGLAIGYMAVILLAILFTCFITLAITLLASRRPSGYVFKFACVCHLLALVWFWYSVAF